MSNINNNTQESNGIKTWEHGGIVLKFIESPSKERYFSVSMIAEAFEYLSNQELQNTLKRYKDVMQLTFKELRKVVTIDGDGITALCGITKTYNSGATIAKDRFVNEHGLYLAIINSRIDEALEFNYWLAGTVIPDIFVNGYYSTNNEKPKESDIFDTKKPEDENLARENKDLVARNARLNLKLRLAEEEVTRIKAKLFNNNTDDTYGKDLGALIYSLKMITGKKHSIMFIKRWLDTNNYIRFEKGGDEHRIVDSKAVIGTDDKVIRLLIKVPMGNREFKVHLTDAGISYFTGKILEELDLCKYIEYIQYGSNPNKWDNGKYRG